MEQKHQGTLNRVFDAACGGDAKLPSCPLVFTSHNHMHDTDTHTNQNECTAECMDCGRRMVDIPDRLAKGGVVASRPG